MMAFCLSQIWEFIEYEKLTQIKINQQLERQWMMSFVNYKNKYLTLFFVIFGVLKKNGMTDGRVILSWILILH